MFAENMQEKFKALICLHKYLKEESYFKCIFERGGENRP